MKKQIQLTAAEFTKIYQCERLRNAVAYAHAFCDKNGNKLGMKALYYPIEYIVTDEQINEAKKEIERAKAEILKTSNDVFILIGMGMNYSERYEDDVCNHRVRAYFTNKDGKKYFIELGTGIGESMRIDHAIDIDKQEEEENKSIKSCNNFKDLERQKNVLKYTKANILKIINTNFDCHFKYVLIDEYTLNPEDRINLSPKF